MSPLIELVLPRRHRHLQDLLREPGNLRDVRPAAAEKHPGAQVIQRPGLLQVLADELENLLQPQRHDAAQVFEVNGFEGQAVLVGDGVHLPLVGLLNKARAVIELELLRTAQRHLQTVGKIVGDVVAPNGQHAGVLDDAVGIDDVIGQSRRRCQ